jgi:Subtilase family
MRSVTKVLIVLLKRLPARSTTHLLRTSLKISVGLLTIVALPIAAPGSTASTLRNNLAPPVPPTNAVTNPVLANGGFNPCLERPVSWRWAIDSVVGATQLRAIASVTVVTLESGIARTLPSFRSFTTNSGKPSMHATAMVSLLVDQHVGVVASTPVINVRSVGFGDGGDRALAREVERIVRSVGVTNLSGDTTGGHKRVVLAMPIGSTDQLRQTRAWIAAGLRSGRVLTVAASGNEATSVTQPGSFAQVLTVGGSTTEGGVWKDMGGASGSNTGPEVDLLGPGCQSVVLVDPADIPAESKPTGTPLYPDRPLPGPNYRVTTGTSSATATVSGAAALLWASQPTLHAVQLKRLLQSGGRESHSNERGFGLASLARIEPDVAVPVVGLAKSGNRIIVRIADPLLAAASGSDGLDGTWPLSGIAKVAWTTDPSDNPKWKVVDAPVLGRAIFENRSGTCKNLCELAFPKTGIVLRVRAMDSAAFAEIGSTWSGNGGRFGEASIVLGRGSGPTTRPPSEPPGTTLDPNVVSTAFAEWRRGFGPLADRWEAARNAIAEVSPPSTPAAGNTGQEYIDFRNRVRPLVVELCKVQDEVRARVFAKWPGWPSAPKVPPSDPYQLMYNCTPGLDGSGIEYAMLIAPRGTPIGDSPHYQRGFRAWDTHTARLRAFIAGQPLPPYPK